MARGALGGLLKPRLRTDISFHLIPLAKESHMKRSKVKEGMGQYICPFRGGPFAKSYGKERECGGWVGRFGPVLVFESWCPGLSV